MTLERGWYAYVGSAARAREARVARHLALEKPLRWHADYLFTAFPAERAWLVDGAAGECELADALAALPGAERRPRRFGAGDCRCAGHLVRFARRPLRRDLAAAAHAAGAPPKRGGTGLRPPPRLLLTSSSCITRRFPGPYLGIWVRVPSTSV